MRPALRDVLEDDAVETVERVFRLGREKFETVRENVAAGDTCGVGAVVHDGDGSVALVGNRWSDGWVLPGGSLEPGESFRDGVRREVREETGLRIEIEELLRAEKQRFASEDGPSTDRVAWYYVVYAARALGDELGDDPGVDAGEIRDAGWFAEVPDDTLGREFVAGVLADRR